MCRNDIEIVSGHRNLRVRWRYSTVRTRGALRCFSKVKGGWSFGQELACLGAAVWQECIPMTIGAVIGGWIGAHTGRRLPSSVVRVLALAVAILTTAMFFSRAYR
ncbi:TSUP family transporter [Rhizobium laguerreae]|uniref:TSUP family transporter n=1 Tax=Rhizobium laguerreae TaxID=1076926 RepID=UPI0035E41FA8